MTARKINTKFLRTQHRAIYTHHEDFEVREGRWVRRRVLNAAYLPFCQWVRGLRADEFGPVMVGKARRIWLGVSR
jgi:hypothetical protein